jgi:hypothetical protein
MRSTTISCRRLPYDIPKSYVQTEAYKNTTWLNSPGGKTVRILTEFLEPAQRFEACGVRNAILFFGSARAKSRDEHARATARAEALVSESRLQREA